MSSKHVFLLWTGQNGKLSFPEIEVSQEKGKFVTTVYRKPTFSGVHPFWKFLAYNIQIWYVLYPNLLFSKFVLSGPNFMKNSVLWKKVFLKNGHPLSFIDNCFKTFVDKLFIKHPQLITFENKTLFLLLPYLGEISLQIRTN